MRKTKKQRFRASILAFLLIASMVLGMVPGSAGQVYAKESTSQTSSEEEPGFIDKTVGFFKDKGEKIASFFSAGDEAQPAAAFDETSVVDADTKGSWTDIVEDSTQNIGRIWTDKSVYNGNVTLPGIGEGGQEIPITKPEGSDFMVGLSALSSTSNTSVTTSTPLDIVLVLDVSGSMSNNLGTTYEYTKVYNIDTSGGWDPPTYYALDEETGQYVKVDRVAKNWWEGFDHWELKGVTVEPKTSRDDNDPNHIQFYTGTSKRISRMEALKDAASAFVDATAVQNQGINEANQHRLSVVTFSDDGDVAQGLTACNANNAQTIKNTIDSLRTRGNTYPGNAMRSAQRALGEARDGAQKVVIFFTDGNPAPAGTNDFNESMANDGVQGALTLKNNKTKIFSIGIFEGADPGNTSTGTNNQFNAYMHAMSSNYPNATAWNQLGEPSTDKLEYYYAATSSDELSEIFQHISEEINTGTGYPTETQDGFANKSGYVTFHDQLGDYMQVDSFNNLILEDITFEPAERTEANGVFTYTYKGSAGENKNVSDIVIKVTPGTGSMGDTVDVSIPAALLPLRHFKVDVSNNTMTVEDKYPLRLFYNVSLKEDARKALADPDQEMKNYIAGNIEGGKVYFYSNKFTGSKPGPVEGQTLGDTTATFEPATGNSFYYFTENTPLYADQEMKKPLTRYNADGTETYYYAKTYYELVNSAPKEVTEAVSFRSHPRDEIENWVGNIGTDEQLYIKAGAPRLTRIYDLTSSKKTNVTGTATEVITPNWDNKQEQRNIEVSLGNNGRLAVELPGTLEIKKTVTSEVEAPKDKKFTFTLTLKNAEGEALTGEFDAQKFNAQGVASGNPVKVQNNGTVTLKDRESVKIYGLSNGDTYSIEETPIPKGFTAKENPITGTIAGNEIVTAEFENTYAATGELDGNTNLKVTKNFTGREGNKWLESDAFTFTLTAADEATQNAIKEKLIKLPETTEITINGAMAEKQAAFGNITFNIAGTFKFNVTEQKGGIAGVTDDAKPVREIVVNVVDNKDGTLTATIADGSDNLIFTNTYGAGSGKEDIAAKIPATKKLTGRDMNADEFAFEVVTRAVEGAEEFTETVVATGTNLAGADGEAARVTFAGSDANGAKALNYTTKSLNKAVEAGYAVKEGNVWTVNYTAREKTDRLPEGVIPVAEKTEFNFTIVVTDKTDGTLTAEVQTPEGGIAFENTYATGGTDVNTDPTEATAYFNKKLTGRDWLSTDAFTFTITPKDGAPAPEDAAADGTKTVTVTSDSAKADALVPFGFGTIRFTDAHMEGATPNDDGTVSKTFTYDVTEVIPEDGAKIPGITYDGHTATLAITVTDNLQGELSATAVITTENGTFTNNYRSNLNYNAVGGLRISKVLNGRDMQKDQFTFRLTPKATEGSTTAKEAAQKLGFDEVKAYEFKNEAAAMGKATYMNVLSGKEVVFTQADAGKTYTYEIVEVKGQNEAYTYDEAVNIVTITVVDNNNGTLTVTTTVKKNGEVVDTKVVSTGDAEAAPATAPFVNVYNDVLESLGGEGSVAINATKSLTNRPMADRKFTFHVTDKNEAQVATGNNDASGKITFTPIEYTTDKLNEDAETGTARKRYDVEKDAYTYTYQYKVEEDLSNVDEGVTGIVTAFSIQVVVTDDGNGNLTIAVVYPDGKDTLPFENAYGTSAEAAIHVNGQKVLNVESGNNAPDITGKYIFTLSGSDGAPMPEKATANNDAAGNVDFGKIKYTMQNVFGDTGVTAEAEGTEEALTEVMPVSDTRTKTFTYTVTESGTVEGVTNDAESVKTFNVTVTDNGDGTIKVDKDYTGFEFGFTNTYHVEPVDFDINDAEAGITVKKELTGRAMNAGEFVFELISDKDKSVREAVNDTDGNVKFETMNFTAPGEYIYTLRERNTKLGGVDYDTTEYQVVVTVTDNGDGTMSAEAKLADEGKDVVFKNQYEAAPTSVMFGASKIYKGADLKDGQFTFVVKDADGNVVSEAKNNKDGMVTFDTIEFNEEGTYTFTISEKNDKQKNVTYDKAVYEVTVTVTDNGEGSLIAEVAYADGKAPVFTNKYTKPAKPAKPEEPKGPTAVKTGDEAPVIPFIILMVATLAIIVTITFIFFRRKRR